MDDNNLASVLPSSAVTSLPLFPIADPFYGHNSGTRAMVSLSRSTLCTTLCRIS